MRGCSNGSWRSVPRRTALAIAALPALVWQDYDAAIRQALLSLQWQPEALVDPFDGLGFRVDSAGFAFAQRAGEMVLLADAPPSPEQGASMAIGRSLSEALRIVNRERFAIKRLHDQVLKVRQRLQHAPLQLAGRHGFRTVAEVDSLDPRFDDVLRRVVQVVVFGQTDYVVAWAEFDPQDACMMERFDRLLASLVFVDAKGAPQTDEVLPPFDATTRLADAFALALRHRNAGEERVGELFAKAHPEIDRPWALAYGTEGWFLRHSVQLLAPIFTGVLAEQWEPSLRQRFPGFDEATYQRALAFARTLQR